MAEQECCETRTPEELAREIRRLNHIRLVQREYIRTTEQRLEINWAEGQFDAIVADESIGYLEAARLLEKHACDAGDTEGVYL